MEEDIEDFVVKAMSEAMMDTRGKGRNEKRLEICRERGRKSQPFRWGRSPKTCEAHNTKIDRRMKGKETG